MSPPQSITLPPRWRRWLAGRSIGGMLRAAGTTIAWRLRRLGPQARAAARANSAFDRQWGTDTSAEVTMRQLEFPPELRRSSFHYQASGAHVIDAVLACAAIDPIGFTFVDLGCGKGRVVLQAAARGFGAAIGVEYSAMLTAIARANAEIFIARGGATVVPRFWQGDAGDYPIPDGDIFFYLYNSFGPEILFRCLGHMEAAKRAQPARRIILAYVNPQHGDAIAARSGWREGSSESNIRIFECMAGG